MAKGELDRLLAQEFICPRCNHVGAEVQRLAMSGTERSYMFGVQTYRYAFVSCKECGYTEVYNLQTLEEKGDWGTFRDIPFSD